ncbi:hypothetical protein PN36_19410 [Candidatus Thiomargarita nelsonii]|uniref:OmpA-like domain-containing protein n=1 Tax=Candidatus Thiomargarita nelsonii TaxID=1003181 RepID=A0A0A6RWG0_9GAMM|nr:hypothetical protein PN36_19410 [Candidatus Thiomargarita nelsonii]
MISINRNAFIKTLIVIIISFNGTACRNAPKTDEPVVKAEVAEKTKVSEKASEKTALKPKVLAPPDRFQQLQKKLAQWNQSKPLVVTLDDKGKRYIETLATFLKQQPDLKVLIEGHSESSDQHHLGLSKRRATAVQFALMKHGISSKRITVKIFGDSQNRRVDVIIF